MSKNIVLFVDGTGNSGRRDERSHEETNVWRLYRACRDEFKLYVPGVGTHKLDPFGGATGFGTKKRLIESYSFLVKHHRAGDNIFLFGFSRGALGVRLLAGFVGEVGTIFGRPEFRKYLPGVYRFYTDAILLGAVRQFREYMRNFDTAVPLPIHFLGVWDTVEEYMRRGLPDLKALPGHITHARHALALHERRGEMEPTLIESWYETSTVKQVFFSGAHADVGGGYAAAKLAEAPFKWIRGEAEGFGLDVRPLDAVGVNVEGFGVGDVAVLHQQRTGGFLSHPFVQAAKGEAMRDVLVRYPVLGNPLLGSLSVHSTAYEHLLRQVPIQFDGPFWDEDQARQGVRDVDEKTLAMILAGLPAIAGNWWQAVTLDDARGCEATIAGFFAAPFPAGVEKCSGALALFVVLKGDEGKLLGAGESEYVRLAWEGCEAKLAEAGVAMPVGLGEMLRGLKERYAKKVQDERDKLAQKGRPFKIELKPKGE